MSVQLKTWIRQVATLSDTALEEELKLINKNSVNAFARAVGRSHRPETDSHTFRSGSYEAHPHADTINLLLSVGDAALSAINSEIPVSPVPYAVSPHMDMRARIKVLTNFLIFLDLICSIISYATARVAFFSNFCISIIIAHCLVSNK